MTDKKLKIKKGDTVKVITGKDKSKVGVVLSVDKDTDRVLVSDVNTVTKHRKPTQQNPTGEKLTKNLPIHISNVALFDASIEKVTKAGYRFAEDGKKVRFSRKSGAVI